jgi:CheY-like chemotaxis protein
MKAGNNDSMNLQVLIVEDDLPSLELMQDVLTGEGAEVVATADTAQAAELIRTRKFDGIFLDLRMPGLNGFQLTELVRESKRNAITPVIIVSGEDAPAMLAAFESGATFYLAKPVDRNKVLRLFRTTQGGITFNRTRSTRVPLITQVTCVKGVQVFRGTSRNISMGGLLFDGQHDLQPGDQVQISFTLPGSVRPITAPAFVVRIDAGGQVGVGFSSLSGEDRLRIRELVAASAA